jgi:exonuclease III
MSCLSWNCRGLGSASTVKELPRLAKKIAQIVLCVLETQVHRARVEGLKGTLGFDNAFAVSSSGRSGGLGIFLNNNTIGLYCYRTLNITFIQLLQRVGVSRGV